MRFMAILSLQKIAEKIRHNEFRKMMGSVQIATKKIEKPFDLRIKPLIYRKNGKNRY